MSVGCPCLRLPRRSLLGVALLADGVLAVVMLAIDLLVLRVGCLTRLGAIGRLAVALATGLTAIGQLLRSARRRCLPGGSATRDERPQHDWG